MKRSKRSIYGVTGLLLVVLSVPLTTALLKEPFGSAQDKPGGHYSDTLQEEALGNQADLRATRRALTRLNARCGRTDEEQDAACEAYAIVQKECFARQKQYYENTGCPTINDMARIATVQKALVQKQAVPALQGGAASSVHAAAASSSNSALTLEDLPASQRLAVRRAIRVQYCSAKLPQAMYLLCRAAVGENQQAAPTGYGNDLQLVRTARRTAQPATLKDRIEMTVPRSK